MRIEIPTPSLVVLVGPAGSGKTTFAARQFAPDEIVSSDRIRERLTGSAGDQSRNRVVFEVLDAEVVTRLRAGRVAVVDATNVERAARRTLLQRAASASVPAIAIVFALPLALVRARNSARAERPVPDEIVTRHWQALERTLKAGALDGEGFAAIYELGDAATIETTRITRVSPGSR
jgi:protein phosphatase